MTDQARLKSIKGNLEARSAIIAAIRGYFTEQGFLEVETPLRIPAPAPEEHIDPEPSGSSFLIASPELQMKRLVAAGYENIFQICRCFRRGERGDLHLPEFSMIEWYRTGGGVDDLMADCEKLVNKAAAAVSVSNISRNGESFNLAGPWQRMTVADAFERYANWRPGARPDPLRFDIDLVEKVEPSLPQEPLFLEKYPASMASLARLCPDDPTVAERFELYAGGLELANGFCELTDPREQRRRFEMEIAHRRSAGKSLAPIDEKFLNALEDGMPGCAGIALGVDRLVMLLVGARSIDEVVPFPQEYL